MSQIDASPYLMDLIFQALDEGIQAVRAGTLTPYTITVEGGARTLRRFVKPDAESALAAAYDWIQKQPAETTHYAIVFEAEITVNGQAFDAIMVEAGERSRPFALYFAQRYHPATGNVPLRTVGDPAYMGTAPRRLT